MLQNDIPGEAKSALDKIIRKSRIHFYKPIQIAEILYRHRSQKGVRLKDIEAYRNISKRWRDEVTSLLVGRASTSSAKYQDNLFELNAMPPRLLYALGMMNKSSGGMVEAYIYRSLLARFSVIHDVERYLRQATPELFTLEELQTMFIQNPGLKRSVDKMYEVAVYALFSTLVRALKAQVTIEILNRDMDILKDFEPFIRAVLGISPQTPKISFSAALYRVGVTNAADLGLDMFANFGPAVQVKHLTLTPETLEHIAEDVLADRIVVVCLDFEKEAIAALLAQVGWSERIQSIVTLKELSAWYVVCLSPKYRNTLGKALLPDLLREFSVEFPSGVEIVPFIQQRGYDKISLPDGWDPKA